VHQNLSVPCWNLPAATPVRALNAVWNENRSMLTVHVGDQVLLQADTALPARSLSVCGDQVLALQGVVLD
jgi:hypothetical protein